AEAEAEVEAVEIVEETTPVVAPVEEKVIERTIEKRGGFVPALIGGVVAAAIGFIAGRTEVVDSFLPAGLQSGGNAAVVQEVQAKLAEQGKSLADLQGSVSAIVVPDVSALTAEISGLSGQIEPVTGALETVVLRMDALEQQVAPLAARLNELEARPITEGLSDTAVAAYEGELAKLKASLATQRAEVEAMIADARALEAKAVADGQAATNRANASQLRNQLDTGAPYNSVVAALIAGGVAVPDTLSASAAEGVVTVTALREAFPAAARSALADARQANKGTGQGLMAFLHRQTGARSTEPREGTDADAVLSRAEAALVAADLDKTLEEISALPETAQGALADWVSVARTRQAALAAADALAQSLNSN
ncbi:COG4223 family protein, partial [Falsiruegeria litorea]